MTDQDDWETCLNFNFNFFFQTFFFDFNLWFHVELLVADEPMSVQHGVENFKQLRPPDFTQHTHNK